MWPHTLNLLRVYAGIMVSAFPDPRMFSIKRATRDPTLFVETNCPVQEQNDRWAVENIINCKNRSDNEEPRLNNKVTRQVDENLLRVHIQSMH